MADKSVIEINNVAGGAVTNKDFPVIPSGKRYRIVKFGGLDANNGDNKSSSYRLRWGDPGGGFEDVRLIALSGNTYEYNVNKTITGDGTKFIRVQCTNGSTAAKILVFWIDAVELR